MTRKSRGITIVTLVELVAFVGGVGIWFALHDAGHALLALVLGGAFWGVATEIEHAVADNVGHGRPPFKGVPFNLTDDGP